jgi:hypothetical protein
MSTICRIGLHEAPLRSCTKSQAKHVIFDLFNEPTFDRGTTEPGAPAQPIRVAA